MEGWNILGVCVRQGSVSQTKRYVGHCFCNVHECISMDGNSNVCKTLLG